MRRQDHVVQPDQWIVGRERLDLEDIEAGAGDLAIAQGGHQRLLVDQLAAADVDEVRRRLHQGQLRRADHPARRGVSRQCRLTKSDSRKTSSSDVR